jgi:ribosomal protein S18 acetylase RimI-like enzyme
MPGDVLVRPLREADLPAAARVCRVAFGTFLGAPDPEIFWADRDYVHGRWRGAHIAAFGAEADGELVGSNFATNWGSVGFFGPITVRPDLSDRGIGTKLIEAVIGSFNDWGIRHAGLFTFPHSPKHIGLYGKFGFCPRFLTPVMALPVGPTVKPAESSIYSALSEGDREACLKDCRDIANAIYQGLDLTEEIRTDHAQQLGDVVLVGDGTRITGFAICHYGPASEAGAGACFIKFAAIRPGPSAEQMFGSLIDACAAQAAGQRLAMLVGGVNTARHQAYDYLRARGFRTEILGITMHRPNEPAYSRAGVYVIDDWR